MTTYTKAQLEAMQPRELDAVVAETVMGYVWKTCPGYDFPLLYRPETEIDPDDWAFFELNRDLQPDVMKFSTDWDGLGLVITRMQELAFALEVSSFGGTKQGVSFSRRHCSEWVFEPPLLPRAAAMAAVLAIQSLAIGGDVV